jgi:hypothetical protein
MKILCLHGYGTSGTIFEEQLSSVIAALGHHHEFVFLDGEVSVTRSGRLCHVQVQQILHSDIRQLLPNSFQAERYASTMDTLPKLRSQRMSCLPPRSLLRILLSTVS